MPLVRIALGLAACLLLVVAIAGRWLVFRLDRRNRDLRLVLGRNEFGSSDPRLWTRRTLAQIPSPVQLFTAGTFAESAANLLAAGNYPAAMWAARLATALESRPAGEALTNNILRQPEVATALSRIRRQPARREEILAELGWPATLEAFASQTDELLSPA